MSVHSYNAIIDNWNRNLGDFLRQKLDSTTRLSIVSAYFTIYAYQDLREELDSIKDLRFLYGEPLGLKVIDPSKDEEKTFLLTSDGGIELKQTLSQKPLARACELWIRNKVEIRTIKKSNFLHGKLYHLERDVKSNEVVLGSSNFTRRGLGFGASPNIELNLEVCRESDRKPLLEWFNRLWSSNELTKDAKREVLDILNKLGRNYAPEFVYYKTLFHVLKEKLEDYQKHETIVNRGHLYDTEIWKRLYSFQKDGAVSAINRLLRHNGCIIADSVGLGKTWTALAVIKYFEILNEKVLVLCPKKLEQNWLRYVSWAGQINNPLAADRLNYTILAHTDLSRSKGKSGNINLSNFNWSAFDLIVIDESHNFRNEGRDKKDEVGELVSRSRYNRLLEDVLKQGSKTKVLMLSATPVNTSLRDLRNQVYLLTEKREDAFYDSLGVANIQGVFRLAQKEFQKWANEAPEHRNKNKLVEQLGTEFLAILDAVSIARSRRHIRKAYPEVEEEIGGFPERDDNTNKYPHTDTEKQLLYDDLHERISKFRLAIYNPSRYVKNTSELDNEKRRLNFNQLDREFWLMGMMRVNLLKRLESSVHSFTLTIQRILGKMEELDSRIERWLARPTEAEFAPTVDFDLEDDEFTAGKGKTYHFNNLNLEDWRADIRKDRETFRQVYHESNSIGVERDAKLAELRSVLENKVNEASPNKNDVLNRKVLVFTTFADTAHYLYENLYEWTHSVLHTHIAVVTGSQNGNKSSLGSREFTEILSRFAPIAQEADPNIEQIDILIATDCLSEGQNLQDCDLVINYDIHWNPVRLMQRFGRIDRIGSRNTSVGMVNFWPTKDLDRYLNLEDRVYARMALVDATATGRNDILEGGSTDALKRTVQSELNFRDSQLQRIREESLDIEEIDDGISLSDLTLDDFLAELIMYLQSRRSELEEAPLGVNAVVPSETTVPNSKKIDPGVIFCLRLKNSVTQRTPNRLHPYFLSYVRDDGTVRYLFPDAKQILSLFRVLAANRTEPLRDLVNAFDQKTQNGNEMSHYENLLDSALRQMRGKFMKKQAQALTINRAAELVKQSESPIASDAFELITWIAIIDANHA